MRSDDTRDTIRVMRPKGIEIVATAAALIVGNGVLALANLDAVKHPLPSLLALALVAAATAALAYRSSVPLASWKAWATVGAVGASTALVNWNLPDGGWPGYASWHLGANTVLMFFLVLRGRTGIAWIAFAMMSAVTLAWAIDSGRGAAAILQFLPNHVGTLLIGTILARGLMRTLQRITTLHAEQAANAEAEARARAATAERAEQAAYLNAVARPALERIATVGVHSDAERANWLNIEATIRDRLRAFVLTSPALADAAMRARMRGVEVTLLDDSDGNLSLEGEQAVVTAIVAELTAAQSGQVTGRVLPPGRGQLATIVISDGPTSRRVDV